MVVTRKVAVRVPQQGFDSAKICLAIFAAKKCFVEDLVLLEFTTMLVLEMRIG